MPVRPAVDGVLAQHEREVHRQEAGRLENDNEVYFAADRPYGLIEATVLRDGREPRIPVDLTNL